MAFTVAAGTFLGVVGGFGTYSAVPLGARLAGWIAMFCVGGLIFPFLTVLAIDRGWRWNIPMWISLPVAVAVASVPLTAWTLWVTRHIMGVGGDGWFNRYFEVLVVALPAVAGYAAVHELLNRRGSPEAAQAPVPDAPSLPSEPAPKPVAFLTRLPSRLGRDLLCLQMEDHYVRVHTAAGSDLILMRMRDAVAELDGLPGLQVHRSWWVAAAAVESHVVDGRRALLKLRNGLEVPIARAAIPTVREAGWLGR